MSCAKLTGIGQLLSRFRQTQDLIPWIGQCRPEVPLAAGWQHQRWTLARIRDLVAARFGVAYTIPGIWYLLRRCGWTCQIGARWAIERDDGAVEVWKKEIWPRIKDRGGPRRLDRLGRRMRPVDEAATVADLGPARDHPGHPGPRGGIGTSRSRGWPATGPATRAG
jgi:hypothetical protein